MKLNSFITQLHDYNQRSVPPNFHLEIKSLMFGTRNAHKFVNTVIGTSLLRISTRSRVFMWEDRENEIAAEQVCETGNTIVCTCGLADGFSSDCNCFASSLQLQRDADLAILRTHKMTVSTGLCRSCRDIYRSRIKCLFHFKLSGKQNLNEDNTNSCVLSVISLTRISILIMFDPSETS